MSKWLAHVFSSSHIKRIKKHGTIDSPDSFLGILSLKRSNQGNYPPGQFFHRSCLLGSKQGVCFFFAGSFSSWPLPWCLERWLSSESRDCSNAVLCAVCLIKLFLVIKIWLLLYAKTTELTDNFCEGLNCWHHFNWRLFSLKLRQQKLKRI